MQRLFGIEKDINQAIISIPEWEYTRLALSRSLQHVVSHYQQYPARIDSSHFLTKLIYSVGVPLSHPLERYYPLVSERTMRVSMAAKMTSSVNKGELHKGVFFGEGSREIILAYDEDFDFRKAAAQWQQLRPIRVLHHPKSDLMLNVPDGTRSSEEEGLSVIAINIPMLLVQYREFRLLEDARAARVGDSPRSVMHFLYAYPIINMLYSQLDVTIFNRLFNLLTGAPLGVSERKHPFYLTDLSDRLTTIQKKQLEILKGGKRSFDGMMKTIPLVTAKNLSDFAVLPDTAPTRQVVWALALSRLHLLSFLFKAGGDPRTTNASEVNRIVKNFQLYRTDQALRSSLPLDLYFDAKADINRIIR